MIITGLTISAGFTLIPPPGSPSAGLLNTFGNLWTWGQNNYGQLADNTVIPKSSPIQTISGGSNWSNVAYGYNHVLAVKTDGTLWGWGRNNYGNLGDNTTISKSSPVQTISGGSNWSQVGAGQYFGVAIKTDETLWVWGSGYHGTMGNNTNGNSAKYSSPIQTVAGGSNWKYVSAGGYSILAIKTDGTLWGWGGNAYGQLADNTVIPKSSPIQTITGGTNWSKVAVGNARSAAIKTDGTLWTWGYNYNGALGTNDTTNRSSPVQTIAGGTNWITIAPTLGQATTAIKTDGTLWVWGYNGFGELGTNDTTHKSSPVQTVAGGTNWANVASGTYFNAATKTDGTLWAWGRNNIGQLGDNSTTNKSSPVQTIMGGTNWSKVFTGSHNVNQEVVGAIRSA
jgi:alpha-tubulin suppressor-like RCC1 family protein